MGTQGDIVSEENDGRPGQPSALANEQTNLSLRQSNSVIDGRVVTCHLPITCFSFSTDIKNHLFISIK